MIYLAMLLIIFSYVIFFLGLLQILYPWLIELSLVSFVVINLWIYKKHLPGFTLPTISKNKIIIICSLLIFAACCIALVGALAPELAFDALWYHLTLPKLYLLTHSIQHISGGLLYYSDMPKLGEMLFTAAQGVGNTVFAKLIQFFFGILCMISLYHLTRRYYSEKISWIAVLVFSTNLVLTWEMTTAYIDVIRTWFELLALDHFLRWSETNNNRQLLLSAGMIGGAITTKLLALGSLAIFLILFVLLAFQKHFFWKKTAIIGFVYVLVALLIPFPWFVFSYLHTGNPVYPFFTPLYPSNFNLSLLNPFRFIHDVFNVFIAAEDPISPIYLMLFPCLVLYYRKLSQPTQTILFYCLLAIAIWYITPRTGGGRFLLPYLPAFSLIAAGLITYLERNYQAIYRVSIFFLILVSVITIGYRGLASAKYFPVVIREESTAQFLTTHLNFSYGDFYDTDRYFATHIKPKDRVLLYGFHNLYYIDFPFSDASWIKPGDTFTYIATQNTTIPQQFNSWKAVYHNSLTHVTVYTNKAQKIWKY